MKFNKSFIPVGICCLLTVGCNQPQQKQVTTNNDDVIWKANLSYCLSTEKLDLGDLKYGLELEIVDMYNFKIAEEKGTFKDLMRLKYL